MLSYDVVLPGSDALVRFIKFQPLSSRYGGGYKAGLHELEYFVEEIPFDTVVVREARPAAPAADHPLPPGPRDEFAPFLL